MDDPIAVILKFAFLIVLYLFLLWVSRSALRDLATTADSAYEPDAGPSDGHRHDFDLRAGVQPRLEVVAAMGHPPGTTFTIGDSATLGRSPNSDVPVDDPYASAAHARIFPRGQFMYIEDMGSTNGTFLNGRQLRHPEQLRVADSIRIGETEWRYQE